MVTVAVAQFSAGTDKSANMETMKALVAQAAQQRARLVVFPEYSMYATTALDRGIVSSAEPLDGPFVLGMARFAAEHSISVLFGINEVLPGDDRVSNTLVLLGPDGTGQGSYRKVHMFDAFGFAESDWVRPGDPDALLTFELDGITFGAMTCYDLRFPELARRLVDRGAQALIVPAQWAPGPQKEDHWRLLARARALENTVYVLAADQHGPTGAGNSLVVDPMGIPLAGLAEATGIACVDLDPARVATVREKLPSLDHRRYRVVV